MNIDSIRNGYVLDHIKAGASMEIYRLLGLDKLDCSVAIIKNAKSTKLGLEVEMISGDEARKLCPYMSEEVVAASWCPSDGHANPLKATLGFYRKALQLGVTFVTGVKVMALEKEGC